MWFVYCIIGTAREVRMIGGSRGGPGFVRRVRGLEEGMPNVPPGHFEAVLTDGRKVRLKF